MNKCNIILTGMMGSGKTSIGRAISQSTLMPFVDTDDLIQNMAGMDIPIIFEKYGEPYFRELERKAVSEASNLIGGVIIATGGGAIMDPENMRLLKKTGFVVYLHCELNELLLRIKGDENRPLLSKLEGIFAAREPLYKKYSDFTVDTGKFEIDELSKMILEEYTNDISRRV